MSYFSRLFRPLFLSLIIVAGVSSVVVKLLVSGNAGRCSRLVFACVGSRRVMLTSLPGTRMFSAVRASRGLWA